MLKRKQVLFTNVFTCSSMVSITQLGFKHSPLTVKGKLGTRNIGLIYRQRGGGSHQSPVTCQSVTNCMSGGEHRSRLT